MKPERVMKMMDKDNKGYVTHEEFMKFYDDVYKRLDRDNNQKLTAQELATGGAG